MIRTLFISATFVAALAVPSFAQNADKIADCRKEGQIATNIMAERKNGANARRAERRVLRGLPADAKNYEPVIPALVDWIYSLPAEQLTADVSNALYQNCLSR